ncbi:phosphatase PAP2 family protein [Catenuloplanes atrovinosus]|uniref:Autotransporter-associated beta strand protein n=1 Tax=Catenuloplanes atrovinosus TaxID=137266 RepID=A0AAE4CCV8_9ACTN|nr:phosphatase PAP2 family protein [Catenuloplanes atrovinosus]MDR7276915.1 autotransporter-associated beta strand protein [Catenuloplanes atrovinosus]
MNVSRRAVLRATAVTSAGLVAGPTAASLLTGSPASAAATLPGVEPFIATYRTNVAADLTVTGNAAVRILSGMQRVWRTGTAWNTGTVLDHAVQRANMRHVVKITRARTPEQAARAFIQDRQHQSYAATAGLGPLAPIYREGALAVTGITSAPDGTPPTKIDDAVPAGAPAGAALGAGSPSSALGQVVTLVNTLRGPFSSGNPSKTAYQYPRPWRMTESGQVVDTGKVDELGYPVYDSPVTVAAQLLRQRSTTPADDGGMPSGHANAFHLAALAYAYAIPERFQELVTAALDLADTRIVSGMHSPLDVIGGRVLATALAAAILGDPANAALKAQAREQARAYLTARVGADLHGYAHGGTTATDPYADRAANARIALPKLTYDLPRTGVRGVPMVVPAGAEVLLETRLPYLTAEQRREVLRTTAIESGHPLLDGPELWGRLNLFAAADGYGAFDRTVEVVMDAAAGGFAAADAWRNDIGGRGGLVKSGTGALTLTGDNDYRGGTHLRAGALIAAAASALGRGDVTVTGGELRVAGALRVRGEFVQRGGTLTVPARAGRGAIVTVDDEADLGGVLTVDDRSAAGRRPIELTVLRARHVRGRFARVVSAAGRRVTVDHGRTAVTVRLH